MEYAEYVKTQFIFPKDLQLIVMRLRVFHFMGALSQWKTRSLSKNCPSLYFNATLRFPLYAPIHLQCLSQFETLHYPWIPSFSRDRFYIHQYKSTCIFRIHATEVSQSTVFWCSQHQKQHKFPRLVYEQLHFPVLTRNPSENAAGETACSIFISHLSQSSQISQFTCKSPGFLAELQIHKSQSHGISGK